MSRKRGRPKKVKARDLVADVDAYLSHADPPILAEFAHRHGITRQYLYELARREEAEGRPELSDAIKRLSEEKEVRLERGGLKGSYKVGMAIFSLKQLGWKDRPDRPEGKPKEEKPREDDADEEQAGVIILAAVEDEDPDAPDGAVIPEEGQGEASPWHPPAVDRWPEYRWPE